MRLMIHLLPSLGPVNYECGLARALIWLAKKTPIQNVKPKPVKWEQETKSMLSYFLHLWRDVMGWKYWYCCILIIFLCTISVMFSANALRCFCIVISWYKWSLIFFWQHLIVIVCNIYLIHYQILCVHSRVIFSSYYDQGPLERL